MEQPQIPTSTRPRARTRQRGVAVLAVVAAVAALSVGGVGIALALEPTSTTSVAGRAVTEAQAAVQISGLETAAGSLVGGEQQVLMGRGLEGVAEIRVGGMIVTDFVATDRSVTFSMPRSERYTAGSVAVEVIASAGQPVVGADALSYAYEVRTGVDRQLAYAFTHWADYNLAEFGTFNPVGGDCANFVSQTLIARGWQMTDRWHNYAGGAQYTSEWIYTPSFDTMMRDSPEYGAVQLTFDQRDQVKVGDIAVFDWNGNGFLDHIQIVSAVEEVDGRIEIKMVGHNRDTDFRDLDETITVDHPNATGYFWSIPAS